MVIENENEPKEIDVNHGDLILETYNVELVKIPHKNIVKDHNNGVIVVGVVEIVKIEIVTNIFEVYLHAVIVFINSNYLL